MWDKGVKISSQLESFWKPLWFFLLLLYKHHSHHHQQKKGGGGRCLYTFQLAFFYWAYLRLFCVWQQLSFEEFRRAHDVGREPGHGSNQLWRVYSMYIWPRCRVLFIFVCVMKCACAGSHMCASNLINCIASSRMV